jgi:hypothetical protein
VPATRQSRRRLSSSARLPAGSTPSSSHHRGPAPGLVAGASQPARTRLGRHYSPARAVASGSTVELTPLPPRPAQPLPCTS